jgi:hypothetical protein
MVIPNLVRPFAMPIAGKRHPINALNGKGVELYKGYERTIQ